MLPLSEKVEILDPISKEKRLYAEVAKSYSKKESSILEVVKKEKEICASFAVAPHTAKVMAAMRDKCLVKTEKALNLYNKIFSVCERETTFTQLLLQYVVTIILFYY